MSAHINGKQVIVEHVYPPIPVRGFDWRACLEGYEPGDVLGYGRTEAEAIADLRDRVSEEA